MKTYPYVAAALATAACLSVVHAQELKCRSEETALGEPNPCTVDADDCCPGLACMKSESSPKVHTCQSTSEFDAAVSHVLVNSASQFADSLLDAMDEASAKVAAANKELEGMSAKASDALDKEEQQVNAKAQEVRDAYEKASKDTEKFAQQAKDKANEVAKRMQALADRVKEEAKQVLEKIKENSKQYKNEDSAAETTTTETNVTNNSTDKMHKKHKKSKDSTGVQPSYSSFVPGSASGSAGGAASGSAGGSASGSFDWQKFMPGAKKSVSMSSSSSPAAGGFDWSKYSPSGSQKDAKKSGKGAKSAKKGKDPAAAGIDWKEYQKVPATNSAAKQSQDPEPVGQQSNEGKSGGPCGKTNFKRFKDCEAGLECESASPMSMGWAPGTCVEKKVAKKAKTPKSVNSSTTLSSPKLPGEEGGPCGTTAFMHFGDCEDGLDCVAPSDSSSFMPSTCKKKKKDDEVVVTHDSNGTMLNGAQAPFSGMDGGFDVSKWDGMPGMNSAVAMFASPAEQTIDDAQVLSMAEAAADQADFMADNAKTAADSIASALHAAADKLKASAEKMRAKAERIKNKSTSKDPAATTTVQDAAAISQVSNPSSDSTMGWYLAFIGSGLVLGTVVVMKNKSSKYGGYDVIGTQQGNEWQA